MHVHMNVLGFVLMCPHSLIYSYINFIMHCYICICLIFLQVMPRPGSSQVSSAAASDVENEGSTEQQHTLGKAQRKRPPEDHADREWKRQKDSDSTGQYSIRICQCIAQTLVQQLDNIREQISGYCKQKCRAILY